MAPGEAPLDNYNLRELIEEEEMEPALEWGDDEGWDDELNWLLDWPEDDDQPLPDIPLPTTRMLFIMYFYAAPDDDEGTYRCENCRRPGDIPKTETEYVSDPDGRWPEICGPCRTELPHEYLHLND